MENFSNEEGRMIIDHIIKTIRSNSDYLSEIDGRIGDGDHGVNLKKGTTLYQDCQGEKPVDLSNGLKILGRIYLMEIGGAMGPLYGKMFIEMSRVCQDKEKTDADLFLKMIKAGLFAVKKMGKAEIGDKTMVDTLVSAAREFEVSIQKGAGFHTALTNMQIAAENGKNSTIDLIARVGRSSRLGDQTLGKLDAGAVSCCLILQAIADGIVHLLDQ